MKAIFTALALATLMPAAVLAAPRKDDVARAKIHFEKGAELYKQARYREAITEFQAAYEAKPHAVMHYNIAQCYEKLGDIPAALKSYREYLREAPNAKDEEEVNDAISNLEKRLAAAGKQQLLINSDPPEAEVWIDGQTKGSTPFNTSLPYGTHKVSLVKPGYRTVTRDAVLEPDRALQLDLTLQVAPSPVPADAARSQPAVAGGPSSPALSAKPDLTPAPPQPLTQPGPLAAAPRKSRVWTWVALGAAGAALAAGTYYGLSSRSASNSLADGTQRSPADAQRLFDDAHSKARTANILFGVAGAAGVAAITLFFVESPSEQAEARP